MGQGIQDFYLTAQKYGFQRDNQLRVIKIGELFDAEEVQDLLVYARTPQLPTRLVENSEIYHRGWRFKVPTKGSYDVSYIRIKFWSDSSHIIKSLFEALSKRQFNEHTFRAPMIKTDMILHLLNDQMVPTKQYELKGCFLRLVTGGESFDIGGDGKPASFEVTLDYQWATCKLLPGGTDDDRNVFEIVTDGIRRVTRVANGIGRGVRAVKNVLDRF